MGLMEVDWETMGSDYTDAALAAVMTSFGSNGQRRGGIYYLICPNLHQLSFLLLSYENIRVGSIDVDRIGPDEMR
jgi:hypothetical protein